jgi:hypothetical protein
MTTWSYFAAVLTDPGRVPEGWSPFPDEQVGGRGGRTAGGDRGRTAGGACGAAVAVCWLLYNAFQHDPIINKPIQSTECPKPRQSAQLELDRIATAGYSIDKRDPRRPRYCKHCQAWKPERSHHCSVKGRCILKMDHYCIWVSWGGSRLGGRMSDRHVCWLADA